MKNAGRMSYAIFYVLIQCVFFVVVCFVFFFDYLILHVHLLMLSLNVKAALLCTSKGRHSINDI